MMWWVGMLVSSLMQVAHQPHAGELYRQIEALQYTGRVLYVAAHPDDENTQLLSWLVGERHFRAAYLSLTRGDGGQNLIGTEQSPLLGLIRTWELLAARNEDGAEQYLGSLRDFGYSKTSEETLAIWGEDRALADAVWVIRSFRPQVVVTRFPEQGETHGHHLASAILARRAFAAAADPAAFPEQLALVQPWQAERLLHNVPAWNLAPEAVDPAWMQVDIGAYDPLLGRSWGEIASFSRSLHRSQGFGWAARRGPVIEYLTYLEGSVPTDADPFSGVATDWSEFAGSDVYLAHVQAALSAFSPLNPENSVPALLDAWDSLEDISDEQLRSETRDRIAELIVSCEGLLLDARAERDATVPGSSIGVTLMALRRTGSPQMLESVRIDGADFELTTHYSLAPHAPWTQLVSLSVPSDAQPSTHYWLDLQGQDGYDEVPTAAWRGAPVSPPPFVADFTLAWGERELTVRRPVRYTWVDPVLGERARTLELMPPVTLSPERGVLMLTDEGGAAARVVARAVTDIADAEITPVLPPGWSSDPASQTVSLTANVPQTLSFVLNGPATAAANVQFQARVNDTTWALQEERIDYAHIPVQRVLRPNRLRVIPMQLAPWLGRVGAIAGPGDLVAESLQAVGVDLEPLTMAGATADTLAPYDAVLVGIRAFNTTPELHAALPLLLDWVAEGGVLVVQYQTNSRIGPLAGDLGPAPMVVGRGRVTDETAAITFTDAAERIQSVPNSLSEADFEGWVQERGLYFAESWDPAWVSLMTTADPNEAEQGGGLLMARHGDGAVFYTGLSFFRQLPAGVPGAYRLLLNLLAWEAP